MFAYNAHVSETDLAIPHSKLRAYVIQHDLSDMQTLSTRVGLRTSIVQMLIPDMSMGERLTKLEQEMPDATI